jgi:cytochrome c
MKKRISALFVMLVMVLTCAALTSADQRGTKAEAKAMVEKALAFVKASGKEKSLAEFSTPKGRFVDKDIYIFAYDFNGRCIAHGSSSKLIGKDLIAMTDPDGKAMIKDMADLAKNGGGWYDYKWNDPLTKKMHAKSAYVKKADDTFWIGSGHYK